MPARRKPVPKYSLHKATGQARCRIDGRDVYLGLYNSPESLTRYAELIRDLSGPQTKPRPKAAPQIVRRISVAGLVEKYLIYLREKKRRREGDVRTARAVQVDRVLGLLVGKYGDMRAEDLGPVKLSRFREELIDLGWTRKYINKSIANVVDCWKWGAGLAELVPAETASKLLLFPSLAPLESDARESRRVPPAPEEWIRVVLTRVAPPVAAMIELQLVTGMRPGEVVGIRPVDLDRSGRIQLPEGGVAEYPGVWVYRPQEHKTAHLGHKRIILIGPKGQEILSQYLNRPEDTHCFSPIESALWWSAQRRSRRKTKLWPSHQEYQDRKRVDPSQRSRAWGDCYTRSSYYRAIQYALEGAEREAIARAKEEGKSAPGQVVPRWHPHQLRHNAATRIGAEFGPEVARIILGHRTLDVTRIYMDDDLRKAAEAMRQAG